MARLADTLQHLMSAMAKAGMGADGADADARTRSVAVDDEEKAYGGDNEAEDDEIECGFDFTSVHAKEESDAMRKRGRRVVRNTLVSEDSFQIKTKEGSGEETLEMERGWRIGVCLSVSMDQEVLPRMVGKSGHDNRDGGNEATGLEISDTFSISCPSEREQGEDYGINGKMNESRSERDEAKVEKSDLEEESGDTVLGFLALKFKNGVASSLLHDLIVDRVEGKKQGVDDDESMGLDNGAMSKCLQCQEMKSRFSGGDQAGNRLSDSIHDEFGTPALGRRKRTGAPLCSPKQSKRVALKKPNVKAMIDSRDKSGLDSLPPLRRSARLQSVSKKLSSRI